MSQALIEVWEKKSNNYNQMEFIEYAMLHKESIVQKKLYIT